MRKRFRPRDINGRRQAKLAFTAAPQRTEETETPAARRARATPQPRTFGNAPRKSWRKSACCRNHSLLRTATQRDKTGAPDFEQEAAQRHLPFQVSCRTQPTPPPRHLRVQLGTRYRPRRCLVWPMLQGVLERRSRAAMAKIGESVKQSNDRALLQGQPAQCGGGAGERQGLWRRERNGRARSPPLFLRTCWKGRTGTLLRGSRTSSTMPGWWRPRCRRWAKIGGRECLTRRTRCIRAQGGRGAVWLWPLRLV